MGLVVCLLKWIFYFTNQTPYHNFSLLCSRSTVLKKSHVQILWGQFKSFVVVQVNNNNSNCCCCGWGRFFRPSSYHHQRETYRFSMGHVKWCVSLFFGFFVWESPQKAVLVFFFPNLRHQVFRGGGSLGASIVRQPLGLKMRSPRIVLIYINLMKLKKKIWRKLRFTSPQILNFSGQNYFSFWSSYFYPQNSTKLCEN